MSTLSKEQIARAWKDADYRKSLTPEQQKQLPNAPTDADELSISELEEVAGGCECTLGTENDVLNEV
ncbi:mersacidin/lichenicidin family type 2 lantibiotic [Exilibacterium tricleocarpae]|uniref:Mersacidin/lichenicidin family type 2 lantibiotic n=1 Tax=Exilibacterium tricleocarpae TaxID=2591008 RepID=A0A545U443_9GAMM|nr:mersacidin/lichenicidin family type 2 lantibiotic [Exilibacterium tricleocarpae]TQV84257.1 mersacidin/lichenicidin family type 2 lantibiotic [Exilibacterium tricleocarpae]